jgi:hypothetical protein
LGIAVTTSLFGAVCQALQSEGPYPLTAQFFCGASGIAAQVFRSPKNSSVGD